MPAASVPCVDSRLGRSQLDAEGLTNTTGRDQELKAENVGDVVDLYSTKQGIEAHNGAEACKRLHDRGEKRPLE